MKRNEKMSKWKIVIGVLLFPFTIMYFMFRGIFRFYKSDKYTKKHKLIITCAVFACFMLLGAISSAMAGPELEKATIKNIELYKDEEKKPEIICTPKDAQIRKIKYTDYDENIVSIENETIKGLSNGKTTIICEIEDEHSNIIKSNKFTVTVKLTKEQIAQKKKDEEKKKKEEQKKLEESRNTISTTEGIRIKDYCKEIIDSVLKSPSTAEYPGSFLDPLNDWNMVKKNNLVTVSSYVDAQNSFGAQIRSKFIIQIKMNDDGSGKATYVQFDGEVLKGTFKK